MSLWVTILIGTLWVLLSFAGLLVLLLSLFHVRYDLAWFGAWTGAAAESDGDFFPHHKTVRLEFGFPGFMKAWNFAERTTDGAASTENTERASGPRSDEGGGIAEPGVAEPVNRDDILTSAQPERVESASNSTPVDPADGNTIETAPRSTSRVEPRKTESAKDPHRARKALFRFATDGLAWKALFGYGIRILGRAIRLLNARVELSAGHPDPAFLGRMAGHWYSVSPLLPTGGATMNFRFQDRQPTFGARVSGGFSLLSLLIFALGAVFSFPVFRLGRRAWAGWRQRELAGWRAWVYRKIQTI